MPYMHVNSPLLDYDLFLVARSAPSQLCLHDTACSGCSYTMLYIYRTGAAGGKRSEPPCLYFYISLFARASWCDHAHAAHLLSRWPIALHGDLSPGLWVFLASVEIEELVLRGLLVGHLKISIVGYLCSIFTAWCEVKIHSKFSIIKIFCGFIFVYKTHTKCIMAEMRGRCLMATCYFWLCISGFI